MPPLIRCRARLTLLCNPTSDHSRLHFSTLLRSGGLVSTAEFANMVGGIYPLQVEVGRLADPCLAADLSYGRAFLALLDDERLLCVRELLCLHAKPPCPAKETLGQRPGLRLMLVAVQVSSIKTRRSGSRSSWLSNQHCRYLKTSGRSCSIACPVSFYA